MRHWMRNALLAAALLPAMNLQAGDTTPATISVTGEGSVSAVPDQATVITGVDTRGPSPVEALESNSSAVQSLLQVLTGYGIDSRDIQTSGFSLAPQYQYPRDGDGEPRLTGYSVSNQLHIRVRDLDQLGVLLEALVKAGSNRLNGIEFGHSDLQSLTDRARQAAVEEARRRAELYANAAGVTVGQVLSITELGQSVPQPMYRVATMDVAAAPPVATGEQQIQAAVQMSWSLNPD